MRAGADAYLSEVTKGKITSMGQLANFAGSNRAANKLRGQLNSYLKSGTNKTGVVDYKSLLTPAERQRLASVNA